MDIRKFEEFLNSGIVKKQTSNKQRALYLLEEAKKKEEFLVISLRMIPSEKMNSNFIVESCYDIIMESVRAKMFIDGYNSKSSHEAKISYMRNLNFSEVEIIFIDQMRYYRNGIKYYGTILSKEYADEVLKFKENISPKLRKLI